MLYKSYYNSPIGKLTLVSDENSLIGLWIANQKYYLETITEEPKLNNNIEIIIKTKEWLDKYFNKENPNIKDLILSPIGSEFRQRVWKNLCNIPYGTTTTYKEIAKLVAEDINKKSMSAQAVGSAISHNPISIIIPCHRVIASNGNLTGYAGGIQNKIKLLDLEQ